MRKKIIIGIFIIFIVVCILIAGTIFLNQPQYEIKENVSTLELNPLDNIVFQVEADHRGGTIDIQNNSEHYIVIDLKTKPIYIEVQQEDGWHRAFCSTKSWEPEPCAITEGTDFTFTFKWKDILGGNLKPGTYRAILFFGDGEKKTWDWFSIEKEFQID